MGSRFVGEVKVSDGEYKDKKTGDMKTSWFCIGKVFQSEKGNYSIRFPQYDQWAAIFFNDEKKTEDQTGPQQQQPLPGNGPQGQGGFGAQQPAAPQQQGGFGPPA